MKSTINRCIVMIVMVLMAIFVLAPLSASADDFAFEWFKNYIGNLGFSYGGKQKGAHIFLENRPAGMIITLFESKGTPSSIYKGRILAAFEATDHEKFLQATWSIYTAFQTARGKGPLVKGTNKDETVKAMVADMGNMQNKLARLFKEASKKRKSELVDDGIRMSLETMEKDNHVFFVMILTPI
jgi:hypothetical protein